MSIANWHLPNRYVTRHRAEEFAKCQRNEELKIVAPSNVRILPYVEQIEERSTVQGDAEQLDHCDGHRKRQLAKHHFSCDRGNFKENYSVFHFAI